MLLNKEQCDIIVENNKAFYRKDHVIQGYNVVVYNYRLASISDFENPVPDSGLKAYEMRGLTFIQQEDGSWERFLALSKFFNYGETIGWMPQDLENKQITSIHEKLDGSLIHFISLPNGEFVAKTKQVFDSPQAIAANRMIKENEDLHTFVWKADIENFMPIFEYTAPDNQIVLPYQKEELRVIQLRNSLTGEYIPYHGVCSSFNVPCAEKINLIRTVSDLVYYQSVTKGQEGWIANMEGKLVKFKTDWYFQQHKAKDSLLRNDSSLLELVLSENFDDAISIMDDSFSELKETLNRKANYIRHWFNEQLIWVENGVTGYNELYKNIYSFRDGYKEFKKEFIQQYKTHPWFHVIIQVAEKGKDADKVLREAILKKYNREDLVKGLLLDLFRKENEL